MSRVEEFEDDQRVEISWLEIFLVVAVLSLTFQLWPNFYFKSADVIYDTLDFTRWGWRSYLTANVIVFFGLAVVRLRQNRVG